MHRTSGPPQMVLSNSGGVGGGIIGTNTTLDAFPKQFVTSMKTLFDILDDQQTGFVKLSDIEKGWQDDGCKGLPHGVVDSLRKVTPTSGLLSFERFCTGLKICLLRNQTDNDDRRLSSDSNALVKETVLKTQRPPSDPLLDIETPIPNSQWITTTTNTAAVRPNNAMAAQRTLSLPQLSPDSDIDMLSDAPLPDVFNPPPKPPRSAIIQSNNGMDKAEIRHALQNWQMGVLMNEMDAKEKRKSFSVNRFARGTADGGSTETCIPQVSLQPQQSHQQQPPPPTSQSQQSSPNSLYQKKPNTKRREPRRHTLQNAIDYNMMKRLKQFEEEKDVLLQGLSAVENARDWYLKQVSNIQEKIKYLGRMGSHIEQWSEAQQERLDLQRARVFEVNRHLSALADSWERGGFPLHMNLAVRNNNNQNNLRHPNDTTTRLKQQNRQLTDEIGQKSERITALEREKQSLVRELMQLQRSRGIIGINPNAKSSGLVADGDVVF